MKEVNSTDNVNQNVQLNMAMISLRRFRAQLDIVPSTVWRWIQRGWLDRPVNIGGRKYLTYEMVNRFKKRSASGEFAVLPSASFLNRRGGDPAKSQKKL